MLVAEAKIDATASLKVENGNVITVEYTLRDAETGDYLEHRDDLVYLHGGKERSLMKLRNVLAGLKVNMTADITLSPEEGFGEYNPMLVLSEPISAIPESLRRVGAKFRAENEYGELRIFRILRIKNGFALIDGNHPLVGRHLTFHLRVQDIRVATKLELEQGYALGLSAYNRSSTTTAH